MYNMVNSVATAMWSRLVNAVKTVYGSSKFITGSFSDIRANGYTIDNITIVTPYGVGGIPCNNSMGVILPIEGSNKSYINIGFGQTIPPCAYNPVAGESWINSQNYVIFCQTHGIQACRVNDNDYIATIPNGEYVGKLILNRITEIENMITEINNNISILNTHTHGGVSSGSGITGTPTSTLSSLAIPSTLDTDKNVITNENYLINNNGSLP